MLSVNFASPPLNVVSTRSLPASRMAIRVVMARTASTAAMALQVLMAERDRLASTAAMAPRVLMGSMALLDRKGARLGR